MYVCTISRIKDTTYGTSLTQFHRQKKTKGAFEYADEMQLNVMRRAGMHSLYVLPVQVLKAACLTRPSSTFTIQVTAPGRTLQKVI